MTPDQTPDQMPSQWQCLLHNLGAWQGSFTRFSPQGVQQEDVPSLVTLAELEDNRRIQQTIQQFSATGEVIYDRVLEYASLNRSILFFENGAFSQGSIQAGALTAFGAELGLIAGNRRLRMVQQFDQNQLAQLTLIREQRQEQQIGEQLASEPQPRQERPPLTPSQLVGTWAGEAVTLYPDWRNPTRSSTRLVVSVEGEQLVQHLSTPEISFTSAARIEDTRLKFEQGQYPVQVLLLPDGASANTPLTLPQRLPFFLEAGWLLEDHLRQRMIRSYDAQGEWVSLTLVTERKISSEQKV